MNLQIFDNYEYLNVSQHSKMFLPIQIVVLLFYIYLPLGQIVSSVERVYRSLLACQRFLTTSRTATSTTGSAGLAGSKVAHFNTCLISRFRNHNVCNRLLHVYKRELIYLIFF